MSLEDRIKQIAMLFACDAPLKDIIDLLKPLQAEMISLTVAAICAGASENITAVLENYKSVAAAGPTNAVYRQLEQEYLEKKTRIKEFKTLVVPLLSKMS